MYVEQSTSSSPLLPVWPHQLITYKLLKRVSGKNGTLVNAVSDFAIVPGSLIFILVGNTSLNIFNLE